MNYTYFFYKQLALRWQIAKQLSWFNLLSLSNDKNYRLKKVEFFLCNKRKIVNIYILPLVHELRLLLVLTFASCIICSVSVMICIFNCEEFTGPLRIVLVFAILTISPLISESLQVNTPVTIAILQKCLGTISS